jgi:cellobiose-specific phosphotransferase system component IIC
MPELATADKTKSHPHYDGVKDAMIWGLSFILFTAVLILLLYMFLNL